MQRRTPPESRNWQLSSGPQQKRSASTWAKVLKDNNPPTYPEEKSKLKAVEQRWVSELASSMGVYT